MTGKLNPNFKFRSGKYSGWTVRDVFDTDPGYLNWVHENKPQMLNGAEIKTAPKPKPADQEETVYLNSRNIRPATYDEAF